MLMCTDPGDLVLDPTCGSGTTAYVAEQWGRRWITCDTSRVPLALARQRLLTATFPYYELKDPQSGPQGGFVYKRRQNRKGEEVGGLVPHITLKSIANDEPPATEVLVDRPEVNTGVTRVAGPFVVEATIAPPQVLDDAAAPSATSAAPPSAQSLDDAIGAADAANGGLPLHAAEARAGYGDPATHIERMTQVLRQSKTLRLPGNRELVLGGIRRHADSDVLHAEGVDAEGARIAIAFGPEDGAISSDVVFEAAREANYLKYAHLYFFGFAIQAKARELLDNRAKLRVPCTYVTVTPDVAMSDLLKTSRASEIFSVTGLPDAVLRPAGSAGKSPGKPTDGGAAVGSGIARPRHLQPGHAGAGSHRRPEPAGLDARHRLRRHVLLRHAGVLPEDRRVGQPAEKPEGRVRPFGMGAPGRHGQRAVRPGPSAARRLEGDRRARQRADARAGGTENGRRMSLPFKATRYFQATRERADRQPIALEWIERVVARPEHEVVQADGRIRRWGAVPEAGGRMLRVVLLDDACTVHNAFFDRSFKP